MVNLEKLKVGDYVHQIHGKRDARLYESTNPVRYFKVAEMGFNILLRPVRVNNETGKVTEESFLIPLSAGYVAENMERHYIWSDWIPTTIYVYNGLNQHISGFYKFNYKTIKFVSNEEFGSVHVKATCHPHDDFNLPEGLKVIAMKYSRKLKEKEEKAKKESEIREKARLKNNSTVNISMTDVDKFNSINSVDLTQALFQNYFSDDTATYKTDCDCKKVTPIPFEPKIEIYSANLSLTDMPKYYYLAFSVDSKFSQASALTKEMESKFHIMTEFKEWYDNDDGCMEIGDIVSGCYDSIIGIVLSEGVNSWATWSEFEKSIENLVAYCNEEEVKYLAIPQIGTRKFNWESVLQLIKDKFYEKINHDIKIVVCLNKQGMDFKKIWHN